MHPAQVFLSLLNYWTDSYALVENGKWDRDFNMLVRDTPPAINSKEAWSGRQSFIGIKRYIENRIIVSSFRVARDLFPAGHPQPSDHYPVLATFNLK